LSARRQRRRLCRHRGAYQRRHDCALHHAASAPRGTGMNRRARPLALFPTYLSAFLLVVVTLAPLVWLFIMSISSTKELTSLPLHWLPDEADFSRYAKLITIAAHSAGEEFVFAL